MPRVYMRFEWLAGWRVSFHDGGTALPRTFLFQSKEKLEELAHRGGGLKTLADRQALEHAIETGAGGMYLDLSHTQLVTLQSTTRARSQPVKADRTSELGANVMRRVIQLEAEADGARPGSKDSILKKVLASRTAILADIVLRTRNILVAHSRFSGNKFEYDTEMAEYEDYTLVCALHEGSFEATRRAWRAYTQQYKEAISETNPLVYAIRLWLGSEDNARREISASTLFAELGNVYAETGQKLTYTAPHAFGTALGKQHSSLRVLGCRKIRHGSYNAWSFEPGEEELHSCRQLYLSMLETFGQRVSRDVYTCEEQARKKAAALRAKDRDQRRNSEPLTASVAPIQTSVSSAAAVCWQSDPKRFEGCPASPPDLSECL